MPTKNVFTLSTLSIAVAASLYACGGGGGGSDDSSTDNSSTQTSTLSGKVSVPAALATASLQKGVGDKLLDFFISPSLAELIGLQVVSGATVQVVELDAAGNETGTVVATVTTNTAGEYSFTSSAIVPGSRYLVKVTKNTLTMRAPLHSRTVNIDPGTEAVVQKVLAQIDGETVTIDNFTPSELSGLVAIVANSNIDVSAASDLAAAVNTITTDTTLALDTKTTDMNTSGDTSTNSPLTGDYHFVAQLVGVDINGSTVTFQSARRVNFSANLSSGTFTHSGAQEWHILTASPSMTSSDLSVTASTIPAGTTMSGSSSYYETTTHQLFLGPDKGASAPDGSIFAFNNVGFNSYSAESEFAIAGKQLAATPALTGRSFHVIGFGNGMSLDPISIAKFDAYKVTGTLDFTSNTAAVLNPTTQFLIKDIGDAVWDGPLEPLGNQSATMTVGATGKLSMSVASLNGMNANGFISGSAGNYVSGMSADFSNHTEHLSIVAIEKATAANNATLTGSYNVVISCLTEFDSKPSTPYDGIHRVESGTGVITFGGNGTGSATFTAKKADFSPNGWMSTLTPSIPSIITTSSTTPIQSWNYSVAPDGSYTTASGTGAVSANGNVLAGVDAGPDFRCFYIGFKQ